MKKIVSMLAGLNLFILLVAHAGEDAPSAALHIKEDDRILFLAPHPDDEAIGGAGLIQSAIKQGAKVKVVYLTQGEHNEISSLFYLKKPSLSRVNFIKNGLMRRQESVDAMTALGLTDEDLIFLGYPDFGTLPMWLRHWADMKPYKDPVTGINKIPYKDSASYGHYFKADNVLRDLNQIFLDYRPTHIFTTAPFDLNSDHRAAFLFSHLALMSNQRHLPNTKLISYLVHSPRWPNRGMNGSLSAGMILPSRTITWDESIDWVSLPITPDEKKKKEEITALYRSQMSYSKNFLLSFASSNELFFEINPLTLECFGENDESLTDKTFSAATPFRETYYWIHEDTFCLSAPLTNLLDGLGVFSVKLFPYKAEAPFELMPKIHMKLFGGRLFVRNGSHTVRRAGITYRLGTKRVLIRIPLSLLKNPEALFVSTQVTNKKALPNSGVWKILKIKNSCKKPSEIKII